MIPHPDSPEFTAAVLGEQISDLKSQISDLKYQISDPTSAADPERRREAAEIRFTAARLTAALRSEPTLRLTASGRQMVLRRPSAARPAWFWPTAAAAGFAALLGGAAVWMPVSARDGASRGTATRLPTVGINTSPTSPPATPARPPAPLAKEKNASLLPAGTWIASPPEAPVTVGGPAPDIKSPAAPAVPVPPGTAAPAPPQRSFASPLR